MRPKIAFSCFMHSPKHFHSYLHKQQAIEISNFAAIPSPWMWPTINLFCFENFVATAFWPTSLQRQHHDVTLSTPPFHCLRQTTTHNFHEIFWSVFFFTSITLRMICGYVVMLRTDLFERGWKKIGKETPTLTRRNQLILMVELCGYVELHIPTMQHYQTHPQSEDNFEVSKRNKFVPSPSNKILWNWLLCSVH